MAKKDFLATEENDRSITSLPNSPRQNQAEDCEEPTDGKTQVKNASATGDGSYGRNDESLPDDAGQADEKTNSVY